MRGCDVAEPASAKGGLGDFAYYAFISYSHKDAKWANWIHRKLLFYRLPSIARKEIGSDVRIRPICKDDMTIGPGPLRDALREKLRESKYLIVVCSPNSAHANAQGVNWIDEEVRYFAGLGRADRIIPVIVDGVPGGGEDECFCPELKKQDILAVDATKFTRGKVLNFVAAKLLGLSPEKLEDYVAKEERRLRRIRALLATPLALILACVGLYAWDAGTPTVRYFSDYVDSYGLPEGIFPLRRAELHGRHLHYRFEYLGYRFGRSLHHDSSGCSFFGWLGFERVLRRVVQAGADGRPVKSTHTERIHRPPLQEFSYAPADGVSEDRLVQISYFNESSVFEKRLLLSDVASNGVVRVVNGIVRLRGESDASPLYARTFSSRSSDESGSGCGDVTQHYLRRDGRGRITGISYADERGRSIRDASGVHGVEYVLDSIGRIAELWYVDGSGARIENGDGICGRRYKYCGRNMIETAYVNAAGELVRSPHGWMASRDSFDGHDNNVLTVFLNGSGEVVRCEDGYAGCRMSYDDLGFMTRMDYIDEKERLVNSTDGFASCAYSRDEGGREILRRFLDADGREVRVGVGYSRVTSTYDTEGLLAAQLYQTEDGNLADCSSGISEVRYVNANGVAVEESYWGSDGSAVTNANGITRVVTTYHPGTHVAKIKDIYGGIGIGVWGNTGVCHVVQRFDEKGRNVHEAYYDGKGHAVASNEGITRQDTDYWEHGFLKAHERMYADQGPGAYGVRGLYLFARDYNEAGLEIRWVSRARDGSPVPDNDGVTRMEKRYQLDNKTLQRCDEFAETGGGIWGVTGICHVVKSFDTNGNVRSVASYDANGVAAPDASGVTRKEDEYWPGTSIRRIGTQFAEHGGMWGDPDIYYSRQICDERGRVIEQFHLDRDGRPAATSNGEMGGKVEYYGDSETRKRMVVRFAAVEGRRTVSEWSYDERGRLVMECNSDKGGAPAPDRDGATRVQYRYYGDGGETMQIDRFADSGVGVFGERGVYHAIQKFDKKGRVIEQSHHGRDGELVSDSNGYIKGIVEYYEGSNDKRSILAYTPLTNSQQKADYGYVKSSYDRRGREVARQNLDRNMIERADSTGLVLTEYAYHGDTMTWRQRDQYAKKGLGFCGDANLHHMRTLYAEDGKMTEEWYFNEKGEPATQLEYGMRGFKALEWDEAGHVIKRRKFTPRGEVIEYLTIYVSQVEGGSPASEKDIRQFDVLVRYDDWTFGNPWTTQSMRERLSASVERGKYVRVVRKQPDNTFRPLEALFPPGQTGLTFNSEFISEKAYDLIRETVRAH